MRSLYLHENLIKKIENLDKMTEIKNLNLSENFIEKIENLGSLTKLTNLQLKRNYIGKGGLKDLEGLLEIPQLTTLDISDNKIDDENIVDEILAKMPSLAVLYL